MRLKQSDLSPWRVFRAKSQGIDTKSIIQMERWKSSRKKRFPKMGYEAGMFLKTKVQKMSESVLSTMCMKTNKIRRAFHDVADKKPVSRSGVQTPEALLKHGDMRETPWTAVVAATANRHERSLI
jgi:hypothetical protein